jgi:predicted phosphoribosyltransferase
MNIDWSKVKTSQQLEQEELDRKAESIRNERNQLLSKTDFMVLPDSGYDTPEVRAYRQALRDITEQEYFPEDVDWPSLPA